MQPVRTAPSRRIGAAGAAATLVLALASGCTLSWEAVGSPLPREAVAKLKTGMSKAEVLEILGPPDVAGLRVGGSVFVYRYRNAEDAGLDISAFQASVSFDTTDLRTDRIAVLFDKRGIVAAFAVDAAGVSPPPDGER